jgi:protoporphyrinogen oxidase
MTQVAVLGAGMAGLGAAHRLREEGMPCVVYDKLSYEGGHAATFTHGDFIFDDGPHISFTKDERIQRLFAESVRGQFEMLQASVNNYWQGSWIKHPAQCNLYGLPTDLVVNVLRDFIDAYHNGGDTEIRNYADWLLASFGTTFARTFPMVYGLKYHTTSADNMTTDWLGPRLYRPALEEVLHGALSPSTPDVHYIDHFRYPTRGGFVAFLEQFVRDTEIRLQHRVVRIDTRDRQLHFANGRVESYDHVISSIPLPDLIPLLDVRPPAVVEAAERLAASECVLVNVALDREDISEAHWTYVYDPDITFTRLSFPHLFSPNNAPPGTGTIQAEVYYSRKYRPRVDAPEAHVEPVIGDLRRCGLIRDSDEILLANASVIPYANVIFDLERPAALELVHGFLDEVGIRYCGRYGDWGYLWTDDSFKSGENAAQGLLDQVYCAHGVQDSPGQDQ